MIEIRGTKNIEDEKEREDALAVIEERESYYLELFAAKTHPPRIKVTFEGKNPLIVRIVFMPFDGKVVAIDTSGYGTADSVTKHAFKKLRRTAKNHFVKTKKQHRRG